MDEPNWPGPLAGVKVLDFTRVLAGPFATQMLADLGAEVWKLEPPGGDDTRAIPPFLGNESHYFLALNRNKKSLVVDLKRPEGIEIALGLAARADVVIENFRPGVMARMGLGWERLSTLNPRLVYCAISGFGADGPMRDNPSFDIVTQALSGAMSVNGEPGGPPLKLGLPLGDMVGGVFGPAAIVSALYERNATGRGRLVDLSLLDGLIGMLGYLAQVWFVTGRSPSPVGSQHPSIAPYGAYQASDGWLVVACLTEAFWRKFAHALGRPQLAEDPRFRSAQDRLANREALEAEVAALMRSRPRDEWLSILKAHDVPHAPILSIGQALAQPQAEARGMIVTTEHPAAGPVHLVGRPVKFPHSPQAPLAAPPVLGQHTREILERALGYDAARIDALMHAGVVHGASVPE